MRSFVLAVSLLLCGCATKKPDGPQHMDRVKVMPYDSATRPPTPSVEILDREPDRPYKAIALITCEGAYHEEVVMTTAIVDEARQLGADAVVGLDPIAARTGSGSMYGAISGTREPFRAKAIIFEK